MSGPIVPKPRTGPAGAYDEALAERERRTAEWLGLDLDHTSRCRIRDDGAFEVVVHDGPMPTRGNVIGVNYPGDGSGATLKVTLTPDELEALREHLGPLPKPPTFVSLWDCRPDDLKPGMKLYDSDGNVVGEVGETVWGRGGVGGIAFGVF